MSDTALIPHADVLLGGTKNITLVARKFGVIVPNAIFSEVSYVLDNPVGDITPNAQNPGLALFRATKTGNATLLVTATVTIP